MALLYLAVIIPDALRNNIIGVHGSRGAAWLQRLPAHLAALESHWNIRAGAPFSGLSFNYVATAEDQAGRPVVLKTGVPCAELAREMRALRRYAGRGTVRLLRASRQLGAMIIERVQPGDMLAAMADDDAATRIAAQSMRELWTSVPEDGPEFPSVRRWSEGLQRLRARFSGGTGPLPARHVERAEGLFAELFALPAEAVLLHADLHHYNILRDDSGWRVIDPKGMAGPPAYECGAWLRNPSDLLSRPNADELIDRRIAIFAECLTLDPGVIRAWSYAQAVLSAWWCVEDNGDCWQDAIALAELMLP